MTKTQQQAKEILNSLTESVNAALDKKKRLGQYAVVWKKGEITYLFGKDNNRKTKEWRSQNA